MKPNQRMGEVMGRFTQHAVLCGVGQPLANASPAGTPAGWCENMITTVHPANIISHSRQKHASVRSRLPQRWKWPNSSITRISSREIIRCTFTRNVAVSSQRSPQQQALLHSARRHNPKKVCTRTEHDAIPCIGRCTVHVRTRQVADRTTN